MGDCNGEIGRTRNLIRLPFRSDWTIEKCKFRVNFSIWFSVSLTVNRSKTLTLANYIDGLSWLVQLIRMKSVGSFTIPTTRTVCKCIFTWFHHPVIYMGSRPIRCSIREGLSCNSMAIETLAWGIVVEWHLEWSTHELSFIHFHSYFVIILTSVTS